MLGDILVEFYVFGIITGLVISGVTYGIFKRLF